MTATAVLIGHQIGYSASPAMHNAAFAALGLDARYELADVAPGALADAVAAVRQAGRLGANVTRPHKVAVCAIADELGPEVERLGAANTLVRDGRRLVARNTDLPALAEELRLLGRRKRAVILGAGGASRAAAAALEDACIEAVVVDRAGWDALPLHLAGADLLVNATPVGTESDESPVPAALLRADLAVLDLVYRPSPTRLVRDARARGGPAVGGAAMLLRQAVASLELWIGRPAPVEAMRAALRAELGDGIDA